MTDPATSWIEQEAIEKWWNKHRFELKQAVTVERVRLQEENESLKGLVDSFAVSLSDAADEIVKLKDQVAQLERMKGIQWKKKDKDKDERWPNEPCGRFLDQCPYDKGQHRAYFDFQGKK